MNILRRMELTPGLFLHLYVLLIEVNDIHLTEKETIVFHLTEFFSNIFLKNVSTQYSPFDIYLETISA